LPLLLKPARLRGVFNHNAIPPPRPRVIDSTRAGTPDSYWQAELAGAPEWKPPPGPIIIVAAHPDDEIDPRLAALRGFRVDGDGETG